MSKKRLSKNMEIIDGKYLLMKLRITTVLMKL